MTAYHGGKQRIGKELASVISDIGNQIVNETGFQLRGYCEPFCGMLGVYQHIPEQFQDFDLEYKAGDINKSVILMWKKAQKGWIPPTKCSESKYNKLRNDGKESAEKGFIGHQLGFAGQYFRGYAPKYKTTNISHASNKVVKISQRVNRVSFSHGDYKQFSKLKGYIIYCDPPYSNTTQSYKNEFDSDEFWDWCQKMSRDNIIFVSEYKNQSKNIRTIKVWSKSIKISRQTIGGIINKTENLFLVC